MARARFKIPDLPADRPCVPDVVALAKAYYQRFPVGGNLHVVLDDGNLRLGFVQSCFDVAMKEGDELGATIAYMMLQMTSSQRFRVYRGVHS